MRFLDRLFRKGSKSKKETKLTNAACIASTRKCYLVDGSVVEISGIRYVEYIPWMGTRLIHSRITRITSLLATLYGPKVKYEVRSPYECGRN
jgi:hypothetical protein